MCAASGPAHPRPARSWERIAAGLPMVAEASSNAAHAHRRRPAAGAERPTFCSTPLGSCTNLCLQQVSTCSNNGTSSVSGTVYAPNGTDPLPGVLVYVPNSTVGALTSGVSCELAGQTASGSPLVSTMTSANGKFTLDNMPVGTNIPLVIQAGKWRRQLVIPSVTACSNTALASTFAVMPKNQCRETFPSPPS